MKNKELAELDNQELLKKRKEIKNSKFISAFIIGFTAGIFIYGAVKNGFGFFTFFPLIIAYLLVKNSSNAKLLEMEVEREIKSRNLS